MLRARPPAKKRPQMMALQNGMGALVDKLSNALKNEIQLNTPVTDLTSLEAPNLILSVPASIAAKLIENEDARSAKLLHQIQYAPLVTVTAFYHYRHFKKSPPKGVGVLIPRNQNLRTLGVLFNSSAFPNRVTHPSQVSLTIMIGGTTDPSAIHLSDEEIRNLIHTEMKKLFQTHAPPVFLHITRWPQAIPIFSSDLQSAQISLKNGFSAKKGRIFFTNYSKEVSLRSLIDVSSNIEEDQ